ncbi:hypothetical protein PanWU01x14_293690 [Parasponia andersonii]|uniref:Uncharacterized protein n=1 Tax=Parasponia andersonii TaxID=3476 RepID=A0A2P5AWB6_PARAD|nr:hypothetical protein PanWU01x14_293690 [Parasponia andersonii]
MLSTSHLAEHQHAELHCAHEPPVPTTPPPRASLRPHAVSTSTSRHSLLKSSDHTDTMPATQHRCPTVTVGFWRSRISPAACSPESHPQLSSSFAEDHPPSTNTPSFAATHSLSASNLALQ